MQRVEPRVHRHRDRTEEPASVRLGHQHGVANALRDLGKLQQSTGDYPTAAATHQQALQITRDLSARPG